MLVKEYCDSNFVNNMSMEDIHEHLLLILEENNDSKLWLLYCSVFPHYTKETYKSFEEFKNPSLKISKSESANDTKAVLDDVKLILASLK